MSYHPAKHLWCWHKVLFIDLIYPMDARNKNENEKKVRPNLKVSNQILFGLDIFSKRFQALNVFACCHPIFSR
jgi:hypothetical protein